MNERKRIIVADDDPSICEGIAMILEDAGYEVETTNDGSTITVVKEKQPHLILLDIWMSGIDGRDICKRLKLQTDTKKIPIIMISANKDTEHIAKEAGAEDFISKPFQMDELLKKVEKYVR